MGSGLDARLHTAGQLDVVVAVDAEHLLHNVALAGNIHIVCRNCHTAAVLILHKDLIVQIAEDILDRLLADILAHKAEHTVVVQIDLRTVEFACAELLGLAHNMRSGELTDELRRTARHVHSVGGVDAALVAERCVGLEAQALAGLADGDGIEVCDLQEDILGGLRHARLLTAEHTCDAHRLTGVGNNQVAGGESSLHAVQSHHLLPFCNAADDYLATLNLLQVEAVQRLAVFVKNEVGDVDDIVDGTLTHGV